MSSFNLIPVDGGDPVHLPPGETVLGRGPLLGISDTRVSRFHGLLENRDGLLKLKPTHLNPCFVQSFLNDDPRPLERGSWHQLRRGDLFSLLPGRLIYRVEAVGGDQDDLRDSQSSEEDELPVSAEAPPAVGPEQKQMSPPSGALDKTNRPRQGDLSQPVGGVLSPVAPPSPRRRVLPAWMLAVVLAERPPLVLKAVKKTKQATTSLAMQASPTVASLPEGVGLSEEEEEPRKKRRKTSNEEEKHQTETDDTPDLSTSRFQTKPSRSKVTEEVDDINPKTTSQTAEEERSRSQVRTPCPYGKACYRKNPLHFQECSHPGDPDHEEEEEEERPECPYGTDCYRKNLLHRKQFRHTKKPARSTRNITKRIPEDEDDFRSSDSEDIGDDSDFVPPESDDSEQEDVQRLQRESKAFLKKRK